MDKLTRLKSNGRGKSLSSLGKVNEEWWSMSSQVQSRPGGLEYKGRCKVYISLFIDPLYAVAKYRPPQKDCEGNEMTVPKKKKKKLCITKSRSAAMSKGSGIVPGADVSSKNDNLDSPTLTSSIGTKCRSR